MRTSEIRIRLSSSVLGAAFDRTFAWSEAVGGVERERDVRRGDARGRGVGGKKVMDEGKVPATGRLLHNMEDYWKTEKPTAQHGRLLHKIQSYRTRPFHNKETAH